MESANFTFMGKNYSDYAHYAYAVAEDSLINSSMYVTQETRLLIKIVLDVIIFMIGIVGNTLTVVVISCDKSMKTVTNFYLLNLAVADLLLILEKVADLILFNISDGVRWKLFSADYTLCYIRNWVLETLFCVVNLTITAVSVERYLAICKPFKLSSKSRVLYHIITIWLISSIFGFLRESRLLYANKRCYYSDVDLFYVNIVNATIFFVLPMIILSVLYTLIGITVIKSNKIQKTVGQCQSNDNHVDDSTKRTLKMLVAVVVVFFLLWFPFHVKQLLLGTEMFFLRMSLPIIKTYAKANYFLIIFTHVMYLLSTVINPIIYSIMSIKFRNAFKEVFKKVWDRRREIFAKQTSSEPASSTDSTSSGLKKSILRNDKLNNAFVVEP